MTELVQNEALGKHLPFKSRIEQQAKRAAFYRAGIRTDLQRQVWGGRSCVRYSFRIDGFREFLFPRN